MKKILITPLICSVLAACQAVPQSSSSTAQYEKFRKVDIDQDGVPEYVMPPKFKQGGLEWWPSWQNRVSGSEQTISVDNTRRGATAFKMFNKKGTCWAGDDRTMQWSDCKEGHNRNFLKLEKPEVGPTRGHITKGWIGYSMYIPLEFPRPSYPFNDREIPSSVWSDRHVLLNFKPEIKDFVKKLGKVGTAAYFDLIIQGDRVAIKTYNEESQEDGSWAKANSNKHHTIAKTTELLGKWTDVYVHFNLVKGEKGFFKLYFGDELMYETPTNEGIIEWDAAKWSVVLGDYRLKGAMWDDSYVLIDEFRIGRSRDAVDVDSGNPVN